MNNLTQEQRRLLLCAHEIGRLAGMIPLIVLAPDSEHRTSGIGLVRQGVIMVLERMDVIMSTPAPSCASTLRVTPPAPEEAPTP